LECPSPDLLKQAFALLWSQGGRGDIAVVAEVPPVPDLLAGARGREIAVHSLPRPRINREVPSVVPNGQAVFAGGLFVDSLGMRVIGVNAHS